MEKTDNRVNAVKSIYQIGEVENLKRILRKVEWINVLGGSYNCPYCWQLKSDGHDPRCKLGIVLEKK